MLNTTYKPSVVSPFQVRQNKSFERRDPLRTEVEKNLGKIILEITVEEDTDTLNSLSGLPGPIIAYKATVRKDSRILGLGRGTAILTKVRKWLESSSRYSINSAILDGVANSLKSLDALSLQGNGENPIEEVELLREATASLSVPTEITRYADAGHGFNSDPRDDYNPEAAKDAYVKTLKLFAEKLTDK